MSSKPKLGGSDQPRKYKLKAEEPKTDQFTDLFGKSTIFWTIIFLLLLKWSDQGIIILNINFKSQTDYK